MRSKTSMNKVPKVTYFTKSEWTLWILSVFGVLITFLLFDRVHYLTLTASLIGVTSLIFNAKGNPFGQLLMVVFSILYGIISYSFAYYGEMITYLGMTAPMALFSLIAWLRNPYHGNRAQVNVNEVKAKEYALLCILTILVTMVFYYVLAYFHTQNIVPSTISVTTSFIAVYLTFRRSHFYALAYAANDVVLIVLWTLAAMENTAYISVDVCFVIFLINDLYGFINWKRIKIIQAKGE